MRFSKKVLFLLPVFFLLLVFFLLPAIKEGFQPCTSGCSGTRGISNHVWKCLNKGEKKYYCCRKPDFGANNINTDCDISKDQ